jgi:hypothetical protein
MIPAAVIQRVVLRVARNEGGSYGAINANKDGAGLSYGLIQWSQRTGALGRLLAEMRRADPGSFAATFGSAWQALLSTTATGSLAPVEGAVLWSEPWLTRFRGAAKVPTFQSVQLRLAGEGAWMRAAIEAAGELRVVTERTLALTYDTAVQQGPSHATKAAAELRTALLASGATSVAYPDLLRAYAERVGAHFRRLSPPASSRWTWKAVGDAWHAHTGNLDLYRNVTNRRLAILADPELSDVSLGSVS